MSKAIAAIKKAREHLTEAQGHLKEAAKILRLNHGDLDGSTEHAEALIVLVYAFDDVLEAVETSPTAPGSDAIGVACHTCGVLPGDDDPQCSWTNGGKAVCFDCGHG